MRSTLLRLCCATAVVSAVINGAHPAAASVDPTSLLTAHDLRALDGSATQLTTFRGQVIVVNFWASWCSPCLKELPLLDAWNTEWATRGGRVVAISIDKDKDNVLRFVERQQLRMNVYHDGPSGLARELDLPSLPCTYLLDADGRVVHVVTSSSADDLAELKRRAEALMGKAIGTGSSAAAGGTR